MAFPPEALLKLRYANLGICHTRYSTTGFSELQNCQPFVVDTLHGRIAVAHNGELVNSRALRKKVRMLRTVCLFFFFFFMQAGNILKFHKKLCSLVTIIE